MTDHSSSPFLNGEVSKSKAAATNQARQALTNLKPWANRQAALKPYKGGTQKTRSSLPLQAKKASARLDRKHGATATPFGVSKALNPRAAASLGAHSGSIPRNSSKFKLSDKLKPGREKKVAGLRQFSQINGQAKPRSTRGTRLDGFTTD